MILQVNIAPGMKKNTQKGFQSLDYSSLIFQILPLDGAKVL